MIRGSAAWTSPWSYFWTSLVMIGALATALWLRPTLELASSLVLLFATAICARYGGFGPSVLAALSSAVAFRYYFLEPRHTLVFTSGPDLVRIGVYLVTAGAICAYTLSLRRRAMEATQALDSLPGGLVLVGRKGSVLFANRRALEMLRCSSEKVKGKRIAEALSQGAESPLVQEIDRALAASTRVQASSGVSDLWFDIHVLDPGRIVSLFIREGKEAAAVAGSAENAVAEAVASAEARSVHDLRQPLGVIANYAELIRRSSEGDVEHYSRKVIESAKRLASLLQELPGGNGRARATSPSPSPEAQKKESDEGEADLVESGRGQSF